LVSLLYNIQIKAIHVGGKKNQVAEAISHWQWDRFRQHIIILVRYLQNFGAIEWGCFAVDRKAFDTAIRPFQ
jgi:hypothetical protein